METQKKAWETPQLIILARGRPEETLTTGCKVIGDQVPFGHPIGNLQDGCNEQKPVGTKNCGTCQARDNATS